MKEYINYLKRNNFSTNTIRTYSSVLNLYINELDDMRKIKNKLRSYFNSPNTVWTHYNILCSYMKYTNDKRIISLKQLKLPKIPKRYMVVFNKDFLLKKTEINEFDSTNTKNKKLLIRFLFETGIRCSEIFNIETITNDLILIKGKGNKKREVFHNFETTSNINFKEVTTKTVRIWVKEILGVEFTPHSIRRSHATHMLLKGANPKMVMMQLGHEKIETTFRYLHLSLDENKNIYKKFF